MNISLTAKELAFLVALAKEGAGRMSSRICDDLDGQPRAAWETFTPQEKDAMTKGYHHWNGDPEEWEPGFYGLGAGMWLSYLASRLEGRERYSRDPLPNQDEIDGIRHARSILELAAAALPEAGSLGVRIEFEVEKYTDGRPPMEAATISISAIKDDDRQGDKPWRVARQRADLATLTSLNIGWIPIALSQAVDQIKQSRS